MEKITEAAELPPSKTIPTLLHPEQNKITQEEYKKYQTHAHTQHMNKIKHYRESERIRKNRIKTKYAINGKIRTIHNKWQNRKLIKDAETLQKATENNNMTAVWQYTKKYRTNNTGKHQPIKTDTGQLTQNATEEIQRWTQWIQQQFQKTEEQLQLSMEHITETQWEQMEEQIKNKTNPTPETQTTPDIQYIREQAELTKIQNKYQYINSWLQADYATAEIRKSIKNSKTKKHMEATEYLEKRAKH